MHKHVNIPLLLFFLLFIVEQSSFHSLNFPTPQIPYKSTLPAPPPLKSTLQPHPSKNFNFPHKINKNSKSTQIHYK